MPGENAYVVVRPKGMNWSNGFQAAPPRAIPRYNESGGVCAPTREDHRYAGRGHHVNDTSNPPVVTRFEAEGQVTRDQGWVHETLKELAETKGDQAPNWAER